MFISEVLWISRDCIMFRFLRKEAFPCFTSGLLIIFALITFFKVGISSGVAASSTYWL